jgi:hypothetical protein
MYIPSSWPSPGGRRNPSFNNRVQIMLNTFSKHPDPPPKGEGFTDPLSGTLKEGNRSKTVMTDKKSGAPFGAPLQED